MKLSHSAMASVRRIFLAVLGVVLLAILWIATEPMRSGFQSHSLREPSKLDAITGRGDGLQLGTNFLNWTFCGEGSGNLFFGLAPDLWEFARCDRRKLADVTPEDARRVVFDIREGRVIGGVQVGGHTIDDGEILFARLRNATQDVYVIEAVEHRGGRGHFRSRRILPDAEEGRAGSNAVPFAPTNR